MVSRALPAMVLALFCAGCGGNPFNKEEDPGADGGAADTSAGAVYGKDMNSQLTMNSMVYDADSNQIVVNNLPFDGATAPNGQAIYTQTGSLPGSPFNRYENVAGADSYYAVFRRSDSGAVEAGAFATTSYVDFGYGGAAAKRNTAGVTLPGSGEYTFTGDYAAVRVFDAASGINAPQYVTGTTRIDVDFGDFDTVGAIIGTVANREVFDVNGTSLGVMDDYVALSLGTGDPTTGRIDGGGASLREIAGAGLIATGDWSGVFGGTNGTEIAGIVVLEGAVDDVGGTGNMRETGVLIAVRTP